jgi:hypothetical protein
MKGLYKRKYQDNLMIKKCILPVIIAIWISQLPVLLSAQTTGSLEDYTFRLLSYRYKDSAHAYGSGFIIRSNGHYYLITVRHNFADSTGKMDFIIPTYDLSFDRVVLSKDKKETPIHIEAIRNHKTRKINYKYFKIDSTHALDVAVLKLTNPAKEILKFAISVESLDLSLQNEGSAAEVVGYPTSLSNCHKFQTTLHSQSLEEKNEYFILFPV